MPERVTETMRAASEAGWSYIPRLDGLSRCDLVLWQNPAAPAAGQLVRLLG